MKGDIQWLCSTATPRRCWCCCWWLLVLLVLLVLLLVLLVLLLVLLVVQLLLVLLVQTPRPLPSWRPSGFLYLFIFL